MAKKLTIVEKFAMVKERVADNQMLVEFIENEIAKVEKKNTNRKPSAVQTANEQIKAEILENMVDGKSYTITEMIKAFPCCADLTNQKVSALVRQLKDENLVIKTEIKGKSYFSKA